MGCGQVLRSCEHAAGRCFDVGRSGSRQWRSGELPRARVADSALAVSPAAAPPGALSPGAGQDTEGRPAEPPCSSSVTAHLSELAN